MGAGVRRVLVGVVFLQAAGAAFAEGLPYRPPEFEACDNLATLTLKVAEAENCFQIAGRVVVGANHYGGTALQPFSSGNLFAASVSQSDAGSVRSVIGIGAYEFAREDLVFNGHEMIWTQEMVGAALITDAFVQVGDATKVTAGLRSAQWGTLARIEEEEPFWWGDIYMPLYWNDGKVRIGLPADIPLGGHVIQIESDLGNGLHIAAGLENIQGGGTAIATARYYGDITSAYLMAFGSAFDQHPVEAYLPATKFHGFQGGVDVQLDDLRVRGTVASVSKLEFDYTVWRAAAAVDKTIGSAVVSAQIILNGYDDPGYQPRATEVGASMALPLAPQLTSDFGVRHQSNGDYRFTTIANRLTYSATETIDLSAELGTVWSQSSVAFSDDYRLYIAGAEAKWRPGAGTEASITGYIQSGGGQSLEFKAERRF